ncbi:MAG: hypothetical protein D6680_21750 [Cyanobacteria bacterium J007]|nr:MAG: hypothetical protein D6680_21750 [Cyanobacteria bacterium J007]
MSDTLIESQEVMTLAFKAIASTKLDRKALQSAKSFLNADAALICQAYLDHKNGIDNSTWNTLVTGSGTTVTILQSITSASAAGAGNLAGYAGIASAVSQLGLGGVTTTLAGFLGSNATGAAATAVVTSAVGGPVVMGTLLAGGAGVGAYSTYKLAVFVAEKMGDWAEQTCQGYDS